MPHPRELNPDNYDSIISAFKSAGFSPKWSLEAPQIVSVIPLVAAGLGVSIVPRSMSHIMTDAVVYLPIDGNAPRALLELAYRQDDRSPAVQNFVAVACELRPKHERQFR
jgi:DNA-binding transcriptional LysR family regulator